MTPNLGFFSRSAAGSAPRLAGLRRAGRLLPMLCWAAVVGCAGLPPSYEGTAARPENRLALGTLEGEPRVWQTREVAVHYRAALDKKALALDGRVERLGPIKHFDFIENFRVSIHFIDDEGIILDSRLLWAAGVGGDADLVRWKFSRRYALPPRASAIGFSYRGTFSENGEDGGRTSWEVRQAP